MTKLTKIGAVALLSIFLTACDKAADKPAQNVKTEQKAEAVKVDTGAQDYKAFREWQHAQERSINDAIKNEMEKLGDKAKDPKVAQEAMSKALLAQIEVIKQSATSLNITDDQVKALKEKSLEALSLGAQMMVEAEKVAQNPTPEAHKSFGDLQAKLDKIAHEGKAIEAELVKKYEPAPQPKPEQLPAQNPEMKPEPKPAQ